MGTTGPGVEGGGLRNGLSRVVTMWFRKPSAPVAAVRAVGAESAAGAGATAAVAWVVSARLAAAVVATNPCTADTALDAVTVADGFMMLATVCSRPAVAFCIDETMLGN